MSSGPTGSQATGPLEHVPSRQVTISLFGVLNELGFAVGTPGTPRVRRGRRGTVPAAARRPAARAVRCVRRAALPAGIREHRGPAHWATGIRAVQAGGRRWHFDRIYRSDHRADAVAHARARHSGPGLYRRGAGGQPLGAVSPSPRCRRGRAPAARGGDPVGLPRRAPLPTGGEIVMAVKPGVDVILAGHTHTVLNARAQGRPVVQASAFGRAFGEVTLTIDRLTGGLVSTAAKVVPAWRFDPPRSRNPMPPDPAVQQIVDNATAATASLVSQPVGTARRALPAARDGGASPAGESPLGDLVADAQRWVTRAQLAFVNPSCIRGSVSAGQIAWGDLFRVQPCGRPRRAARACKGHAVTRGSGAAGGRLRLGGVADGPGAGGIPEVRHVL
jgi:5'-nucleotidase, C-terminal domain